MTQVKGGVINNMQDTPANRDRPAPRLSRTIQIGFRERRKHRTRLCPHFFQTTHKVGGISGLSDEFSITVSAGRVTAHHFRDPEMLGASDVDSQNRQRVCGVLVIPLDRTPIQSLWRKIGYQLTDLPTQVFNSPQVVLQF